MKVYINGDGQLSPHFKASEFRCKDGTSLFLFDTELIYYLEKIREHFKQPVTISSGYRTKGHNEKVGGSATSLHMAGQAADIVVKGILPIEVAKYAETLNICGIGLYSTFVHIDTREVKKRWDQRAGIAKNVSAFGQSFK